MRIIKIGSELVLEQDLVAFINAPSHLTTHIVWVQGESHAGAVGIYLEDANGDPEVIINGTFRRAWSLED